MEEQQSIPPRCKKCGGAEMIETPGYPGIWRCPFDPEHTLDLAPIAADRPPPEMERRRHWLSAIGIEVALLSVRQSNVTNGAYCLPLGTLAKGGGDPTGKAKKKKSKKPWEVE